MKLKPRKKVLLQTIEDLKKEISNLKKKIESLENSDEIKGLIPICAQCKKIRDENNEWEAIEGFIKKHNPEAEFSHTLCPGCSKKLYPDIKITG